MSKRLQILLGDEEYGALHATARRHGVTVSAWVRQLIRDARGRESTGDPARKLEAIRVAASHSFPAGDIDTMLAEIEQGYLASDEG